MKTDAYLSLCLEQAAKSPLHYRHGSIIVNGGKVIGHGYNDYKPGFNGGALKHGRIAKGSLDGPAIADLKDKLKQKDKPKQNQHQPSKQPHKSFVPFEGTGGGHNANVPLSIHSEMMAVHSALAVINGKRDYGGRLSPPTSRPSARPANAQASCRFKSAILKLPHINQVPHHHGNNNNYKSLKGEWEDLDKEQQKAEVCDSKEKGRAFHERLSGEKHHHQKKKEKNGQKEYQYQYRDQYDRYGQQTQPPGRHQLSGSKSRTYSSNGIRGYESTTGHDTNGSTTTRQAMTQHSKHQKNYKRTGKMRSKIADEAPQPAPLLVPKGQTGERNSSLKNRKKHPRLNGADLYVTRLGSCDTDTSNVSPYQTTVSNASNTVDTLDTEDFPSSSSSLPSLSPTSTTSIGSLHDELINREPSPGRPAPQPSSSTVDFRSVRSSRPCYRCISYMHSVGIKRVFWTNDSGQWEGAKVRDLVDALDCSGENVASGGPTGNGVFVTKHEVLMLRRMMGSVD